MYKFMLIMLSCLEHGWGTGVILDFLSACLQLVAPRHFIWSRGSFIFLPFNLAMEIRMIKNGKSWN